MKSDFRDSQGLALAMAEGFKPDPIISISEWADKYRQLPESNAEPGAWRTDRAPFLRKVMDCFSPHSPVRKIVVMKASQLGFTEALLNVCFYYIDYVPTNQMLVYPTKETAERTSKSRITKSAQAMPSLKDKIGGQKKKESGDTLLQKDYAGGSLFLSGANSPATLASLPIRILQLDEVDRFPDDCGGEGNPVDLAEKRTSTFSNSKKVALVSTPVAQETSIIAAEYENSSQQLFHVPCPHCEIKQPLVFENLIYQVEGTRVIGEPEYQCAHCGKMIAERFKNVMLKHGEWVAQKDHETEGFFINGLYSPLGWVSWKQIATEEVECRNNEKKKKVYVNTRKGEPYFQEGEMPDIDILYLKRELYPENICPHGVLFLTMGVDVQEDRLEGEVVGYGMNGESWSITYKTFRGDTSKSGVWSELEKYISTYFEVEGSKTKLPLQIVGIDTGYRTQQVYRFVRKFGGHRVHAFKGQDTYDYIVSRPKKVDVILDDTTKKKKKRGIDLYHIGVSGLKEELYMQLKQPKPDDLEPYPLGYCHFPEYGRDYFESLASEKSVVQTVGRTMKRVWLKVFERNEALDVRVYARAGASLYGYDTFTDEQLQKMHTSLYIDEAVEKQQVKDGKKKYTVKRRKGTFF